MAELNTPGVNMLQSRLLLKYSQLIHGFTTKRWGNLSLKSQNRIEVQRFWQTLNINPNQVVGFEQVHQTKIVQVVKKQAGKIVAMADGGITQTKGIVLAVNAADCLPIVLYEPNIPLVAAIHAGWRGILGGIIKHVFKEMEKFGGKIEDLLMTVGPHIGGCCYDVKEDRARLFVDELGRDSLLVYKEGGKFHLDLGRAAYKQAIVKGARGENIDIMLTCTSCQNDQFFSYRREGKNLAGAILGFIGLLK